MSELGCLLIGVGLLGLIPMVLYVSAKLVAFGWCRGKQLFEESQKGKTDGKE